MRSRRAQDHHARPRRDPAHDRRADDGRALLAGDLRRLSRGGHGRVAACRASFRCSSRQRGRSRRRRCSSSARVSPGSPPSARAAGSALGSRRSTSARSRRSRSSLGAKFVEVGSDGTRRPLVATQRGVRGLQEASVGGAREARGEGRRDRLYRARSRAESAGSHHRRDGEVDEAGLRDRRSAADQGGNCAPRRPARRS